MEGREQTIQDLLKAAEKIFNNKETPEEREERLRGEERELAEKIWKEDREHRAKENQKNQRELAQILFAGMKAEASPVRLRQYPMSQEARGGSLPTFDGSWMPEFSSDASPLGTPPYCR